MKYLKIYEKYQTAMKIEYDDKVFYIIYGNNKTVSNVLTTIVNNRFSFNNFWVALGDIANIFNKNEYVMNGSIIYSTPSQNKLNSTPMVNYWVFKPENKNESMDSFINKGYAFKGELKIENDDVILDTLEVYTRKYNI